MENPEIAAILDEIAQLLELKDANQFRIRSYRNAAQTVRNQAKRIEDMVDNDEDLSELPDIGDSTAEKLHEIVETGTCKRLEDLQGEFPEGLTELLRIPDLGPRKVMDLYEELGVESVDDLRDACEDNKVQELEGMGEKTEAKILDGIRMLEDSAGRMLRRDAEGFVEKIRKHLDATKTVQRAEIAGSFRRAKETVGDLDFLIQAEDRDAATEQILKFDAMENVDQRGKEKVTVTLRNGLQVDFRFFNPESFGAALLYFTGAKAHNIKLRQRAQNRDWKLNEYGLYPVNPENREDSLDAEEEADVYEQLDLPFIAPCLREDRGEIDAAEADKLPDLIKADDVRGDLQMHTTASDGHDSIKAMAEGAADLGHEYIAITDHSKRVTMANGLDDDQTRKHAEKIRRVNDDLNDIRVLAGIEVDILKDGSLDLDEGTLQELDWVVASIHYDRNLSRKKMTERYIKAMESGVIHCIGHPLGRLIGKREPFELDFDKFFDAAVENQVCIEINGQPDRLDLPDQYVRNAREAGVQFCFGTDAHNVNGLQNIQYALNVARRGWLTADEVLNTSTVKQLEKALKRGS